MVECCSACEKTDMEVDEYYRRIEVRMALEEALKDIRSLTQGSPEAEGSGEPLDDDCPECGMSLRCYKCGRDADLFTSCFRCEPNPDPDDGASPERAEG
jgi:hypothetical protein